MKRKFKIIFMGTPEFAVPSLTALVHHGHDVPLVVTRPDRPRGRGRRIAPPPVKTTALDLGLEVIQPAALKTGTFMDQAAQLAPDFFIVVAFGHILSEKVLALPRFGAINVHASLLPRYRGPAPIQWAIINGEKETGVTTMRIDKGLDTGDILLTAREPITADDTAATLQDRLALRGAELLTATLEKFAAQSLQPIPQDHHLSTFAPLLAKKDGRINWEKSAESLNCFIRGVTPWPGAFTFHADRRLKIFKTLPIASLVNPLPGTVLEGFPDELRIATGNGVLSILEIQGPSGKRLSIAEFLRGYRLRPGDRLE